MVTPYSLTETLDSSFKSQTDATRRDCDQFAQDLAGGPVVPCDIQGAFSYTVIAGQKSSIIIQFRSQSSLLDMEMLTLAHLIHPEFVPSCHCHGTIGCLLPLSIYMMDRVPGTTRIQFRCSYDISHEKAVNTVRDFGRFYAQSWTHRQKMPSATSKSLQLEYARKLGILAQSLPPRFASRLRQAHSELSSLFAPTYPLVVTHGDLCEMNIIVDSDNGHVTGIIDWAEGQILPFGISLWGLENVLGSMGRDGWQYREDHQDLRDLFWESFYNAVGQISEADRFTITAAMIIGLFFRYGFSWDEGARERPVDPNHRRLRYLDALLRI